MIDHSYLIAKRDEILAEIKPICEAFNINDYDYIIDVETGKEQLRLYETLIGCASNSISAVVDELIGYIFIKIWCGNHSLGAFSTQCKNVIRQYWVK